MLETFSLPFLLLVPCAVAVIETYGPRISRAFVAALAYINSSQQIAADRCGLSQAQLSRRLASGRIESWMEDAQGPEFMSVYLPLRADISGVEPRHYAVRQSA